MQWTFFHVIERVWNPEITITYWNVSFRSNEYFCNLTFSYKPYLTIWKIAISDINIFCQHKEITFSGNYSFLLRRIIVCDVLKWINFDIYKIMALILGRPLVWPAGTKRENFCIIMTSTRWNPVWRLCPLQLGKVFSEVCT